MMAVGVPKCCKANGLTTKTVKKPEEQALDVSQALALLQQSDIDDRRLKKGQTNFSSKVVTGLKPTGKPP